MQAPSLPPSSLAERAREPTESANVASTGVWANEGSISAHTLVLLFQPERLDMNVTLGRGEGQGRGREKL